MTAPFGSGEVVYPVVGALIAAQAMGAPLPGETALIAAAAFAAQGRLSIVEVLVVAAAAAIVGGGAGYAVGQRGRRWLQRSGRGQQRRQRLLARGERFFARHGPKAVFFGRWISGLRIIAAPLAGVHRMRWPTFMFWNALGGLLWPTSVGLVVYFLGKRFVVLAGAIAIAALISATAVAWRRREPVVVR
jgi:membrane protein DedA with SNARE-associated domain